MLGHTYKPDNLFWSEKRGVVNATESTADQDWVSYSGEYTCGYAKKAVFHEEFKPMVPADCDVRKILLRVVPGDGSGHEVYARNVSEVEELLSEMGSKIEDFELSRQKMKPQATEQVNLDALEKHVNSGWGDDSLVPKSVLKLMIEELRQARAPQKPHGVVICDKRIPNALETFIPQRFYTNHHWGDEYSKVEVFAKSPPKLSEAEFDALDTALVNLKHHRTLNPPAQRAVPVIRAMILAHDPTYQEVKF